MFGDFGMSFEDLMGVSVRIYNKSTNPNPEYAQQGDAGMDIRASEHVCVYPGETKIIKTGLYVAIPRGYELQVRPRSGMSAKTNIRIANAPGTVDSNYRGEIGVIVDNTGNDEYIINVGDRIAQLVLSKVPTISWFPVENIEALGSTNRGAGGFGSTGKE